MARSDPGPNYGKLVLYRIPSGRVEAPDFVHSEIRKNDQLTEFLRDQLGSVVTFGQMTLLLVDDTIVYVRPVYVEAASATAVPELSRVIAVNADRIEMGETLDEALAAIIDEADSTSVTAGTEEEAEAAGSDPPPREDTAPSDYDPTGKSVVELIADAEGLLADAETAESSGLTTEAAAFRAQARDAQLTTPECAAVEPTSHTTQHAVVSPIELTVLPNGLA